MRYLADEPWTIERIKKFYDKPYNPMDGVFVSEIYERQIRVVIAAYEQAERSLARKDAFLIECAEDRESLRKERDTLRTQLHAAQGVVDRAKHMLYVASCRDDGINEEMRILWKVLALSSRPMA